MEGKEAVAGCKEKEEGLNELMDTARRFLYQHNFDCLPRLLPDTRFRRCKCRKRRHWCWKVCVLWSAAEPSRNRWENSRYFLGNDDLATGKERPLYEQSQRTREGLVAKSRRLQTSTSAHGLYSIAVPRARIGYQEAITTHALHLTSSQPHISYRSSGMDLGS